jgi:hypothetical protein
MAVSKRGRLRETQASKRGKVATLRRAKTATRDQRQASVSARGLIAKGE